MTPVYKTTDALLSDYNSLPEERRTERHELSRWCDNEGKRQDYWWS